MSCSRCQGLMVDETLCNPNEGFIHAWVPIVRCLNCGNLEDSLIRRARCMPEQRLRATRPLHSRATTSSDAPGSATTRRLVGRQSATDGA